MKRTLMVAVMALVANLAVADTEGQDQEWISYLGMGLLPVRYLEFPGPDCGVRVLRLSIFAGYSQSMKGLDFATIGNWTEKDMGGIGLAAGYNVCQRNSAGVHLSCVNYTEEMHRGFQLGLANMTWGLRGLQIGLVNATSEGRGFQMGLYNLAEDFYGVQFGLVNMNHASPAVILPLVNMRF